MDEQQKTSSIVSSSKKYEYDVFLSFRGEDTRKTFTSYLDKALNKEKIKTFIDDRLEKGDEISTTLIKAIENSRISIVIFSKNYASSKWCLNELTKIMDCKRVQEQIVMSVFYDIDPSHVRNQTEAYKDAFEKHKEDSRCEQWRNDLNKAANIAGWDSRNSKTEPELLDDIVKVVLKILVPKYSSQHDGLVGIEHNFEELKSLLKIGSDEVKIFGIWGMGGIGKTTLANVLYEKLSPDFEGRCFLENVREKSEKRQNLCEEIFSKLSSEKNRCFEVFELRWLLQRKRVFIVLDDVAAQEQLKEVIYQFYPLGPGSRVIVTTRNKQIFRLDDVIYPIQKLSPYHSLELFCLSAFEEKQPKDGYKDISKEVISYCGGIPLALEVVGASLRSKSKEVWECQLNKLRSIPDSKIQKALKLKLSYDDLDDSQQSIFLDIACFFKGELIDSMFPVSDLEVLLDKSLIKFMDTWLREVIEMHDLIQEMGHEIVRQESIKYPEKRSRLWKHEEVVDILKRNEKNDVVEGIILDLTLLDKSLNLSYDFLAKMTCLRFLKIHGYVDMKESFNIYLHDGLVSFSDKLRYLHWESCCLESLPSKFCAEQLVVLRMQRSKLKKLWDGVQNLVNLKEIDLQESICLTEIPDLSKAKTLERVTLYGCKSLHRLHPSISSLPKLKYLNLHWCSEIGSLNIHSKYLSQLNLRRCSSLTNISVTSDELTELHLKEVSMLVSLNVNSRSLVNLLFDHCPCLKEISMVSDEISDLNLSGSAITSLPSSISSLPKLTSLDLRNCKEIKILDLHSKSMIKIDVSGCSSLKEISMTSEEVTALSLCGAAITSFSCISSLPKLKYLDLSDCKEIEILDLHSKSLIEIDLSGCSSLKEISMTSKEVIKLKLSGTAITSVPLSISSLPKLTSLNLSDCKKIKILDLHSKSLTKLNLSGCSSLKEISMTSDEVTKLKLSGTAITSLPSSISSLPKLINLDLSDCKEIEILDLHSKSLIKIDLNGCSSLKEISMTSEEVIKLKLSGTAITSFSFISSLPKLKYLDLSDCKVIEILDLHSKSLEKLVLIGCSSLKKISMVSEEVSTLKLFGTVITSLPSSILSLPKLKYLDLSECRNLVSLPELPSALHVLRAFYCNSLDSKISQHLALQHMLQKFHQQQQHNRSSLWDEDYFVFPGDVIYNCVFQTTKSSISILALKMSHLSGFIYCIILPEAKACIPKMRVSIYQDDVLLWHWHSLQYVWPNAYSTTLISEHVWFWYDDISEFDGESKAYDDSRNVEIKFQLEYMPFEGENVAKGFGVFPVYATTSGFELQISESQSIQPEEQPCTSKRRKI